MCMGAGGVVALVLGHFDHTETSFVFFQVPRRQGAEGGVSRRWGADGCLRVSVFVYIFRVLLCGPMKFSH